MSSLVIKPNDISAVDLTVRQLINAKLEKVLGASKPWHQYPTTTEYRLARLEGRDGFRKPEFDAEAQDLSIPSSRGDHIIPLHKISPKQGTAKGVYLHFHGGAFVINSPQMYDIFLRRLAESLSVTVVSVDYRKAPEHPFPAPQEDALDAALFALSLAGKEKLGGQLRVIGGESAGAYLGVWTVVQLQKRGINVRQHISAMALTSGMFDLTFLPSARQSTRPLVLNYKELCGFVDAAMPSDRFSIEARREWSPLYADLHLLPPAIFLVGTEDPLLDDSVFMAAKWALAGNKTILKIIPEGCHTFINLPTGEMGEEGIREIIGFVQLSLFDT